VEHATPISGRLNSSLVNPEALNNERWGARSTPLVITSLLITFLLASRHEDTKLKIANLEIRNWQFLFSCLREGELMLTVMYALG
jgi:hypothetical protein